MHHHCHAMFALAVTAMATGCAVTTDTQGPSSEAEDTAEAASAYTILETCYGDNDLYVAPPCFRGSYWDGSFAYDYNANNQYWWNDVRYSDKYLSSAQWNFTTTKYGEVWFSAWVPSANATGLANYAVNCGNGSLHATVDQKLVFGKWVTLGDMGYLPVGTQCSVYVQNARFGDRLAMDGMKMTTYQ